MRRKLFTLAAAISLVVFLLAMGIWVRSYFWNEAILRWNSSADAEWPGNVWGSVYFIAWEGGSVGFTCQRSSWPPNAHPIQRLGWEHFRQYAPALAIFSRHLSRGATPWDRVNLWWSLVGFQLVWLDRAESV